jgi:hypothetical protein
MKNEIDGPIRKRTKDGTRCSTICKEGEHTYIPNQATPDIPEKEVVLDEQTT